MSPLLALVALTAWPALAQDHAVTTTLVGPLTGPGAPSDMRTPDVCGTDIGTMAEMDGTIIIAFGDTFGWQGGNCRKFGPNMRSNAIAFTTDTDPSDGVTIDDSADGRAIAAIEGRHMAAFTGEQTRIPTAMVAVGDTLYLHDMAVHGFTPGLSWLCNHSRFISSKDGGRTWDRGVRDFGDHLSGFNMLALSAQPGAGNAAGRHVYALGTPCGRAGGARAARVPAEKVQDTAAWEYWDGTAWTAERARAVEVILPGVGEASLVWNAGIGRWMHATVNEVSKAVELRFAERPQGPWSDPAVMATTSDHAMPYGAFMTPSWISADGLTFYFVMSQFGPYNAYVMKAVLHRRTD
jgi:hypothetical protein